MVAIKYKLLLPPIYGQHEVTGGDDDTPTSLLILQLRLLPAYLYLYLLGDILNSQDLHVLNVLHRGTVLQAKHRLTSIDRIHLVQIVSLEAGPLQPQVFNEFFSVLNFPRLLLGVSHEEMMVQRGLAAE